MHLRGVDTNLLVALRALLLHQNVTLAARELGITQSAMSHTLSRLREQFDDQLLTRVGRELVLTERAKSLKPLVLEAAQHIERVFANADGFDAPTSDRTFWIASPDNLALYVLPHLAQRLCTEAPHVNVRVCALPLKWQRALERGEIDLKIGRKSGLPDALRAEDLSVESFSCVVRTGHPVTAAPTLKQYAALNHLLITPNAEPGSAASGVVDTLLQRKGLARRVAMSVPHFLVAPEIVAASDLVLTAPTRMVRPLLKRVGLREIALPFALQSYTLTQMWAARADADAGLTWLRGLVREAFVKNPSPATQQNQERSDTHDNG